METTNRHYGNYRREKESTDLPHDESMQDQLAFDNFPKPESELNFG